MVSRLIQAIESIMATAKAEGRAEVKKSDSGYQRMNINLDDQTDTRLW